MEIFAIKRYWPVDL